jgi:hypothetical protein
MNPSKRRRKTAQPQPELLEGRSLMTGGVGDTFAMIPGTISQAGGTTSISITIDPSAFTMPKGKMTIGIDIAPQSGSSVAPLIKSIDDPHGNVVPQAFTSIYNPHLSHAAVGAGAGTRAVLVPITQFPGQPARPTTYTVNVEAQSKTSGSFLLDFYLPGDANGNGTVEQTDLNIIRSVFGARAGQPTYNFDADVNRDGRIGPIDLAVARENLGVRTNVLPIVTADLSPASDSGLHDRVTNIKNVQFTGMATPGATITYTEINQKTPPVTTTADANGNYVITIPLALGVDNFQVVSQDGFGQSITGQITPVTYDPNAKT